MTADLERRLRALRDELPEPPLTLDPTGLELGEVVALLDTPARRRRIRWVVAGLVAAALVAGVVVAVEVVRGGRHVDRRDAVSAPSVARIDPTTQVVHLGDRVEGDGQVLAVEGEPIRFCAPVPISGGLPLVPDPLDACPQSLTVTGVDLAALNDPHSFPANGRSPAWVTGYAHLVGTYGGDRLTDVTQSPYVPGSGGGVRDDPPCPAPDGGWPHDPDDLDLTPLSDYQSAHPGEVVAIATLRPSYDQAVAYALTAGDPAPVADAMRPTFGDRLCVARSHYSAAELEAAQEATAVSGPLWKDGGAWYAGGPGSLGPDGQPVFSVGLPVVTDQVVADVAGTATGLVQFDVWLSPVR